MIDPLSASLSRPNEIGRKKNQSRRCLLSSLSTFSTLFPLIVDFSRRFSRETQYPFDAPPTVASLRVSRILIGKLDDWSSHVPLFRQDWEFQDAPNELQHPLGRQSLIKLWLALRSIGAVWKMSRPSARCKQKRHLMDIFHEPTTDITSTWHSAKCCDNFQRNPFSRQSH